MKVDLSDCELALICLLVKKDIYSLDHRCMANTTRLEQELYISEEYRKHLEYCISSDKMRMSNCLSILKKIEEEK